MSTNIVGVDIGTTGVRAVELQNASKKHPRIVNFAEMDLPQGAVVRGEVVEMQTVASALKRLWGTTKFSTKRVVIGMGNQSVLARDLTVPVQSPDRLRESLPFQVQDMLPVPVNDALLDFYPATQVEGEKGAEAQGLLIAAIKQTVIANVDAIEHAKLNPVEVDLIPFALCRLLLSRPGMLGTSAVIDFGASCTTVVAAIDGVPRFMRMIPSGSADITETIRQRLEVDPHTAENYKRHVSLTGTIRSENDEVARTIIAEHADELVRGLRNTINYVSTLFPHNPITDLLVSGGGSRLGGLTDMVSELTGVRASPVDPFRSVGVSRNLTTDSLRSSQHALTVALGLALGSEA